MRGMKVPNRALLATARPSRRWSTGAERERSAAPSRAARSPRPKLPGPVSSSISVSTCAVDITAVPQAVAGPAAADLNIGDAFQIECDNGATYGVVTPGGQGAFTPAFDVDSNTVLFPVVLDGFTGTTLGEQGKVIVRLSDDAQDVKGSGKQRGLARCVATFTETVTLTADEAESEGLPPVADTQTIIGERAVLGQIRGR